ncbi:DUF2971 domain-containing protein [Bacillus sp. FSL R5-0654]|uniref:DUF2971 domain-containing protein n=1 Tax=Bacillus sp. FSL R5-0654 TaxID=2954589 RepID=UPI0030F6F9BE
MQFSLWKYMSLAKFIDLLKSKQLFYCRADLFEDKFEGSSPLKQYEFNQSLVEKISSDVNNKLYVNIGKGFMDLGKGGEHLTKFFEEAKLMHYISCWHQNEAESEAMWKLYLQGNEGVAIRTTGSNLYTSISNHNENSIMNDFVEYIDFNTMGIDQSIKDKYNWSAPFFVKRNHYSHEKEYRSVIRYVNTQVDSNLSKFNFDKDKQIEKTGLKVDVDLTRLINEVYVSPFSAPYFKEIVSDLLRKYEVKDRDNKYMTVKDSNLNKSPIY